MGKTLHCRLRAYAPDGTFLGHLRPSSWDASFEHDDAGTLKVTYPRTALGGDILKRGLEAGLAVRFEVSDGGAWSEPYNGRFLLVSRSRDAKDRTDTVTLNFMTWAWLLKKMLNLNLSALLTDTDNKGKRPFYSANPGTIVKTFLDENRGRGGAATLMPTGFDTGHDSAGTAWKYIMTLYYDPGIDLYTVLSNLTSNGVCDWRTEGDTLRLWNADSTALCRDLSGSVHIQLPAQLLESPEEETIEDLASNILVKGDNGLTFQRENAAAPTPYGKWELYSSQGGVSDEGTAAVMMTNQLETAARVRGQYTRQIVVEDVEDLPLVDYRPGDWITAPTVSHGEKVRVQRVTLSMSSQRLKCALILNDRLYDSQTRQAKRIQGITGGAVAGGAQGGRPAPEKDHRVPKAPTGLIGTSDAYINENGFVQAVAYLVWDPVSEATDNTAIDVESYQVDYRKNIPGTEWRRGDQTDYMQANSQIGGLDSDTEYAFRVRAVPRYSDRPGEWSGQYAMRLGKDVTPPSVPSKPVLSSDMGIVIVKWDGRTANGARMEPDFDHIEVAYGDSAGTATNVAASLNELGFLNFKDLEIGRTYWFRLRAVDHAGNASDWSEASSIEVKSVISNEEIENEIMKPLRQANKDLAQAKTDIQNNKETLVQANKDLDKAKQDIQANEAAISQANKDLTQAKTDIAEAQQGLSDAKKQAADAYQAAHSRNRVYQQPTAPVDDPKGTLVEGDLWLETQAYWTQWEGTPNNSPSLLADFYTAWQGEANNSPSVLYPLADRVIASHIWRGGQWVDFGYADVEDNKRQIEQAKQDILDNAAHTQTAQQAADSAKQAAQAAQSTADKADAGQKTANQTATAAQQAANSATTTANSAKEAADAAKQSAADAKQTATNASTTASTAQQAAQAAKDAAADAKQTATEAKTTASDASKVATQSKATADSAAQAATSAQTTANRANEAAAQAAGIANGKADVLIQDAEPAAAMRKATTLWIDTTNGGNKPKRWNGSAWVVVTDKAALDAANAAATAKTAADTAQSTAQSAQTAAANADAKAQKAQDTAEGAQTTADGKSSIWRQSDEPKSQRLKPGDQWWVTQAYWTQWEGTPNNSPSLLADFYTAWQGEANNSPSVLYPLADRVIDIKTWDGSQWNALNLVASNIVATGTVTAKHLAVNSVTAEKISANAVTADKIMANSITSAKLAADSVIAGKIAAGAVTSREIKALAITADKLAANSVNADKLTANSVTSAKIVSGAVTTDKLAANSVNADKLVANSVTSEKIVSNAVTADKIAANSIVGDKIAANAVTGVKIKSRSITADKIAAGAITAYEIHGSSITGDKLAATAIDGKTITGATIRTGQANNSHADFRQIDSNTAEIGMYNKAGVKYAYLRTYSADSSGDDAKMTLYTDSKLDIRGEYMFCNGVPADGGFCYAASTMMGESDGTVKPDSHGSIPLKIVYQEKPGNGAQFQLDMDGHGVRIPHDGWYFLSGVANMQNTDGLTASFFFGRRQKEGNFDRLAGHPCTQCITGNIPKNNWMIQTMPTIGAYLWAGDVVFVECDNHEAVLGSLSQLTICKLPFGNIYHGGQWN